jgi:tryptophanyl-tRNA synthetase
MYPVLMGADILMFNAHSVPVGRDQIQHIEMARDMAASFNHRYGTHFVVPQAAIEESVATLPGLDGRKMSKSYDNTIALFAPREQLKKLIAGIVTDSKLPGEPKTVEGSALYQIYQAFASAQEATAMQKAYAGGIGWGDAKQMLFERIDSEIAPMRAAYEALMAEPAKVEAILQAGAEKARAQATPFMHQLRRAVGLRSLADAAGSAKAKANKTAQAVFKQYKEGNGQFYFKLVDAKGLVLLQSKAFDSPKDAGLAIAQLRKLGVSALPQLVAMLEPVDKAGLVLLGATLSQMGDNT